MLTPEQSQRVERAVSEIERGARFVTSPMFEALVEKAVAEAVAAMNTPWLRRAEAAAYARCSVSELNRAVAEGAITPHKRGGTPLYRKDEIDAAIQEGRWPAAATVQAA